MNFSSLSWFFNFLFILILNSQKSLRGSIWNRSQKRTRNFQIFTDRIDQDRLAEIFYHRLDHFFRLLFNFSRSDRTLNVLIFRHYPGFSILLFILKLNSQIENCVWLSGATLNTSINFFFYSPSKNSRPARGFLLTDQFSPSSSEIFARNFFASEHEQKYCSEQVGRSLSVDRISSSMLNTICQIWFVVMLKSEVEEPGTYR